jgi:galacturan 1,4-alpha-galacturonidase
VLLGNVLAKEQVRDTINDQKVCTVIPRGNKQDDVPSIVRAFQECNNSGKIVFPRGEKFWIASKLHVTVSDVNIDWYGLWTVCNASYY